MKPNDIKVYILENFGTTVMDQIKPAVYRNRYNLSWTLTDNLERTDPAIKALKGFAVSGEAIEFVQQHRQKALSMLQRINQWIGDIDHSYFYSLGSTKAVLGAMYIMNNQLIELGVKLPSLGAYIYHKEFKRQFVKSLIQLNWVKCNHIEFIQLIHPEFSMHEAIHYYNHDLDIKNTQQ